MANNVSNQYLADTYLHEIIHAITTDPINNAKTKEDIKFRD
nr:MAG TPA: SprT-like family protein [Caudoviricetes sp.]